MEQQQQSSLCAPECEGKNEQAADIWRMVRSLREERGETGEQFGVVIGLSKGKVSELETGKYAPSLTVALKLEALSDGRIDAAALNDDVARARAVCPNGCGLIHARNLTKDNSPGPTGQADDLSGDRSAAA